MYRPVPYYKPHRRDDYAIRRIKEIAQVRIRYGYQRIHVLLRREGWRDKRVNRVYKEEGRSPRDKTCVSSVKDEAELLHNYLTGHICPVFIKAGAYSARHTFCGRSAP